MSLTITCRKPSDLVAAAIGVLGFVPEESVVMLTFGGTPSFHARVDLDPNHERLCEALLDPAVRYRIPGVAFLVFTDEEAGSEATRSLVERLVTDFTTHGIAITAPPLVVSGGTIRHQDGTTEHSDWRSHPGVAALVADGRPIASSREALSERVQQTSDALTQGPKDIAVLLEDLLDGDKRDQHLMALTRHDARQQADHWLNVARHAPETHAAPPCALAGIAAWLSGDGALAWVCVDRAQHADPNNRLAGLLTEVLTRCIDPATWDDLRRTL